MNPHLLGRQKVKDYAQWKKVFDEGASSRIAAGSDKGHIFVSADDPNEVFILLRWDDMDKMRQFAQSDELRQAMERAGVEGRPEIYFLDEVEKLAG